MTTRVEMTNRALVRIGADPIQGEDDPSAIVHLAVYDSIGEYLAAKPWSFLKRTVRLARKVGAPGQHWLYRFQMPPEFMGPPRAIYPDASFRRATTGYDIDEHGILSNFPELWAIGTVIANPARWPGDFREGFSLLLMSELALSVREDRVLRNELRQQALGTPAQGGWGGLIGQALDNDSMAVPEPDLAGGVSPLTDGRFG